MPAFELADSSSRLDKGKYTTIRRSGCYTASRRVVAHTVALTRSGRPSIQAYTDVFWAVMDKFNLSVNFSEYSENFLSILNNGG